MAKTTNDYLSAKYNDDMSNLVGDLMIEYKKLNLKYNADEITEQEYIIMLRILMHKWYKLWEERVFTKYPS